MSAPAERPLWSLSAAERRGLHAHARGQVGDLRRTAVKLEMARAPYKAAERMSAAADTIERLEAALAEALASKGESQ